MGKGDRVHCSKLYNVKTFHWQRLTNTMPIVKSQGSVVWMDMDKWKVVEITLASWPAGRSQISAMLGICWTGAWRHPIGGSICWELGNPPYAEILEEALQSCRNYGTPEDIMKRHWPYIGSSSCDEGVSDHCIVGWKKKVPDSISDIFSIKKRLELCIEIC